MCWWERRVRREEETVRVLAEVLLARMAFGFCPATGGGATVEGLLAMAEVERKLVGRRDEGPVLLPAEESCLSRRCCWTGAWEASWWSLMWGDFGVVADEKAGDGPGVLVDGDRAEGDAAKDEVACWLALAEREAELLPGPGTAEDCERWRMVSSDGLRRRSWLLDARWPGVWLRGIWGVRSLASSAYDEEDCASVGEVAVEIFCDRTTLFLTGECGVLDLLSAIAGSDSRVCGRCRCHGRLYQTRG